MTRAGQSCGRLLHNVKSKQEAFITVLDQVVASQLPVFRCSLLLNCKEKEAVVLSGTIVLNAEDWRDGVLIASPPSSA
jgi:hypothetical protein